MTGFRRFLVILVSFSACWICQLILFPEVPHLNTVPNLLLAEVMACGCLFGKTAGLFTGAAAGLVLDFLGIGIPGFFTLILSVLGWLDGRIAEKMDSEMVLLLFIQFIVNEFLFHAYSFALSFLLDRKTELKVYVREIFVPETLLTLWCFLLLYAVLLTIAGLWDIKGNKGEIKVV